MDDKLRELLARLSRACANQDWDTDAWSRGIEVLERKFGVQIYLSSFRPTGMIETTGPVARITITPTSEVPK